MCRSRGGGVLASQLLGIHTVAACEIEPYPRSVLLARQRDGILPLFPIWDDIRTLDGTPFRGHVDLITGGFPCQDISAAGKGAGITGTRSGLWSEMHRIICEIQPRYAFMENSPMLTTRGLGHVLADLASSGYHAAWLVLGASDLGAPHHRKRIWILARHASHTHSPQRTGNGLSLRPAQEITRPRHSSRHRFPRNPWAIEPDLDRVAHGVAARVDRLRAIGNGQVPLVAATAFLTLKQILEENQP
ncbi:MAG: DNA cytosine methyltransferase [Akkermansia sp.]|nr:DNA cytosine methyltransferase [Akkermansia sp.]